MPSARSADRGVLAVTGPDARAFLDRLVTCDVDAVAPDRPGFGALLTPQGKIIADFVLHETAGGDILLDVARPALPDLAKRLALYRLRAKVALEDRSDRLAVVVGWDDAPVPAGAEAAGPDPRIPALGWRAVVPDAAAEEGDPAGYERHRIAQGVPTAVADFALNDAYPHETLMDQLGGVSFDKGCYIGQEVVSRMQHRGTARTRIVPVLYGTEMPEAGADVTGGGRVLGRLGSLGPGRGLATLRLDRVGEALAAGEPIAAGPVTLRLAKPGWVRFPFPGDGATATP